MTEINSFSSRVNPATVLAAWSVFRGYMGVSKCCLLDCNFLLDPHHSASTTSCIFFLCQKFADVPMFLSNTLSNSINHPQTLESGATVCSVFNNCEINVMNNDAA